MSVLLSYALTNVADVKESMGIVSSDKSWDNIITRKINQATRQIEAYCGRRFLLTTYTQEVYAGSNIDQIVLRQRPVVGAVTIDVRNTSLDDDDWESVQSNLFFADLNSGVVDLDFRAIGRWGRYRATYQAGYTTIPEDLAEACASLAAYYTLRADASQIGLREKREGSRMVMYDTTQKIDFESIMEQLGIDELIKGYSNYPVLADR